MTLNERGFINEGLVSARLNNHPTSPRKMRLVVDIIRGKDVHLALDILKHSKKHAALPLEKLLLSAISNFRHKFPEDDVEKAGLFIQEIRVDSGSMLKRLRPAPQGRGHRIRKRSNHVTLVLGVRISSNEKKSIDS